MRIRSIKPEFWADEQVAGWPPHSRLAYIALWNEADDEGRLRASAAYLKSRLFPYEPTLDMEAVLHPIIEAGKLVLFEHAGQRYGYLPTFHQHQVINRPTKSKLPKPIVSTHSTLTDDSVSAHGVLTSGTGNRELGKEQGKGNKEKEQGYSSAPPPTPPDEMALLEVEHTPAPRPSAPSQCEAIYAEYPRKQGRAGAIKAIEKALKSATFEHLRDRTRAYAEATRSWNDHDRGYIPHPETWFHDERYDDDPQAWVRKYCRPDQVPASDHSKGF